MPRWLLVLVLPVVLSASPARAQVPPFQFTLGVNTQLYMPGIQLGLRWWRFEICGSVNTILFGSSADVGAKLLVFSRGSTPYVYGRTGGISIVDEMMKTAAMGAGYEHHFGPHGYVYGEAGAGYYWSREEPFDWGSRTYDFRAGVGVHF